MLNVIMLNVITLNVIMLNVIMLNAIMLNVVILSIVSPKRYILWGWKNGMLTKWLSTTRGQYHLPGTTKWKRWLVTTELLTPTLLVLLLGINSFVRLGLLSLELVRLDYIFKSNKLCYRGGQLYWSFCISKYSVHLLGIKFLV